jgi:pantoate--beta-alanine ligase
MDLIRRVPTMKEIVRQARAAGKKIGFVPTMGYLHDGHMKLVRRVKELSDVVVVSIFVNPTQFGPNEDLASYPRDLPRDTDLCIREGVHYVFAPEAEDMYPTGSCTFVDVFELSSRLEGESRPGHFRGVATVVLKLLNVVRPHVAAFGQKDAQQAIVLRRMVRDLMLDVEILVLPIVRDTDGVALSSRNVRLSPEERKAARGIPKALQAAEAAVSGGERDPAKVVRAAQEVLEQDPILRVDYVALVDTDRLEPVQHVEGEMLLAVAVFAGAVRLIDNVVLGSGTFSKAGI